MTQIRTATRRFGLSKSKITAFEQCPKKLWLATHRPELAEQDDGAEARFATGNAVGEIACALHPGGVMVDPPSLSEALAKTSSLISGGHPGPIFEATFEHDGVLVRVDVLERLESGGWAAVEVKSSGRVKDYHRGDLATQVWVMREAGISLQRAAIRHIDTSFVLSREGDYAGLFTDADLLADLEDAIATRPTLVAEARATLSGGNRSARWAIIAARRSAASLPLIAAATSRKALNGP
ncbi:Dna2/Cas4 domain-containing protein [Novosphingobium sp. THN1]|uniref:Dna2/Cas4 domain-containing protein n=1 Tax=Novosphingobium sp. THN1 TaxID=1016987 RepID=UPI001F07EC9F|nr:Dna2/Cas4 domain-containing protein [Novosphingobium sp. THN1]